MTDNPILIIGRLHFLVPSGSRSDVAHVVDLERGEYGEYGCSCERFTLHHSWRGQPCPHIRRVVESMTKGPAQ